MATNDLKNRPVLQTCEYNARDGNSSKESINLIIGSLIYLKKLLCYNVNKMIQQIFHLSHAIDVL